MGKTIIAIPVTVVSLAFGFSAYVGNYQDGRGSAELPNGTDSPTRVGDFSTSPGRQTRNSMQLDTGTRFVACMRQHGYHMWNPSDQNFTLLPKNADSMDGKVLQKLREDTARRSENLATGD